MVALLSPDRRPQPAGGGIPNRLRRVAPALLLAALLALRPMAGGAAPVQDAARQASEADLRQFIAEHFPHWDRNQDGALDLQEINKAIESPAVQGREAATIVAAYRQHMDESKGGQMRVGREELLALAGDRKFAKQVEGLTKRLAAAERRLFLPSDPDLSSFHQGRVGDCYLLSPIAAAVNRDPQGVRDLIRPAKNGGFEVRFGDGRKVRVAAITDAELLMGAKMDGTHGIWLTVLEKAYGIIRERERTSKKGLPPQSKAAVPYEVIGGGNPCPVIALLTGHQADHVLDKDLPDQKLHELLTRLTRKRRLICCGTEKGKTLPPGVGGGHIYAIFGYDNGRRQVKVFNPWGNTFTPSGAPGLANGYATVHGVFVVPLAEFRKIFKAVRFETGNPARE